jgi:hypothetical protein
MTPFLIAAVLSQAPAPAPSAAALETRTLTVSVVDDKGNPLRALGPQDVAVQEDGIARELTRVELDQRPLTVAVLVDTSESAGRFYRLTVVDAILQFLLRLPEGSRYALWTTGDRPTKILDYGETRAAAARALRRVVAQGGNTLLDALVEASRDLKEREDARSAIVVVTGTGIGFANYDRRTVVDTVSRHPATVLAVQVDEGRTEEGLGGRDFVSGPDYDYVLSSLAKSSGGVRETVLSSMGIERVLKALAAELTSRYRISYLGPVSEKEPKVEVTIALPGVKVRMGAPQR